MTQKAAVRRVDVITDTSSFHLLEGEWRALLTNSATRPAMMSPDWMLEWWSHYRDGRDLVIIAVRKDDDLIGLLPMCRRSHMYRRWLSLRRLEVMGSSGSDRDGACGEYLEPICSLGYEREVAEAVIDCLQQDGIGIWHELVFEFADTASPSLQALSEAAASSGLAVSIEAETPSYAATLPATWDGYLATLPSKHRSWLKRSWRVFESWAADQGGYVLQRASTSQEVDQGLSVLADLHGERWREDGQEGAFASARFRDFHRGYAHRLHRRGELDLLVLKVNHQPVAAHYSFAVGRTVYFYQSGRRMDAPGNVRLGIALFILAIQDAIERGMTAYDFLAGDSAYKHQFATDTRLLSALRVSRRSARNSILDIARSARQLTKGQPANRET